MDLKLLECFIIECTVNLRFLGTMMEAGIQKWSGYTEGELDKKDILHPEVVLGKDIGTC